MADTHLKFVIGSTFSGEGFKQAQAAVANVNKNVKRSNEIVGKLSGALGQMDTSMAKGAAAATSMIQAFMTLNVTTIAIQGAMLAFNMYVQKVNEEMEELTKRAEKARDAVAAAFTEKLSGRIGSIKAEIADISSGFENVTKYANAVTAAMTGVRTAEGSGDIIALQTEKLNEMLAARTEEERQSIEQSYAIRVAKANLANVEAEGALKLEAAHQAVIDSQNRIANINEQISAVSQERSQLEEIMFVQKQSEDENWLKTQKRVNELKEIESKLEEKKIAENDNIELLTIKEQEVKQQAINSQAQANNAILELELSHKVAADKANASAEKSQELTAAVTDRKRAEEDAKAAADELAAREKESAELQRQLNSSKEALAKAQDEYRQALLQHGFSNDLNSYYSSSKFKGGTIPVEIAKSISLTAADQKVDDAIRSGVITTVRDADEMRKREAREGRNVISRYDSVRSREAQRAHRLREENYKVLCQADKHFLEEYSKIEEAQQKQQKAVEDSKKKVEEQTETIKDIKDRLEDLGLK